MHRESSSLAVFLATLFSPILIAMDFFFLLALHECVCEEGGRVKPNRSSVLAEQN
jgi:hypothetical protein